MPTTLDDVSRALLSARWVFAKTMAHNPHEWTQRKDWKAPVSFDDVVTFIRENGYPLVFGRRTYICFDVGPHRYWSMGDPLPVTRILNRALGTADARLVITLRPARRSRGGPFFVRASSLRRVT